MEVKQRKQRDYGHVLEMISKSKYLKMMKTIQFFLESHPSYWDFEMRIDFIGFEKDKIYHLENISL